MIAGGESGIRTHETVARLHAFQACSFGHSDTSPDLKDYNVVWRVLVVRIRLTELGFELFN